MIFLIIRERHFLRASLIQCSQQFIRLLLPLNLLSDSGTDELRLRAVERFHRAVHLARERGVHFDCDRFHRKTKEDEVIFKGFAVNEEEREPHTPTAVRAY